MGEDSRKSRPTRPTASQDEDPFSEKVIAGLEGEGLTIRWRYGYKLANRYEVKRVCAGGMGVVYIVEDLLEKGKRYAAKSLKAYFRKPETEEQWERWRESANDYLRECNVWVDLGKHRHIVEAEFLDKIEGVPLVMSEFIDGGDLKDLLKKGPLDLITALDIAIQACIGMEYAGRKGVIVHRDIKPANILITVDGVAKVNDFGISKAIESAEAIRPDVRAEAALGSTYFDVSRGIGTPGHMAPEQYPEVLLESQGYPMVPLGREGDVYAFGLVLYEMITGKSVTEFVPDREIDEAFWILSASNPGYPHEWWAKMTYFFLKTLKVVPPKPSMNEHLNAIVLKCLNKYPSDRYHDFSELRKELMKIYREETGGEFHIVDEPTYEPSWRNRAKTYWVLGREKECFECYERALKQDPADTLAWLEKGLASAEDGDLTEFGLYMEIISHLRPSTRIEVQRYKTEILGERRVRLRDVKLLERLSFGYPIPDRVGEWISNEAREFKDPFREPNPVLSKLLADLKDVQPWVQEKAIEALGELGDTSAVSALVEFLNDPVYRIRWRAAVALAKLGDKSGIPVLAEVLKDHWWRLNNPDVIEDRGIFDDDPEYIWNNVAESLSRLGESAVPSIMEALREEEPKTQRFAYEVLATRTERITEMLDTVGKRPAPPSLIENLKESLNHPKYGDSRVRAAIGLARLGDKSGLPVLAEALNDPYYMLDAAIVLGELGERSAVSAMTGALRDESYVVREKAAEALGRLEDRSAVPALIEALKDETDSVRERVVSAIGRLCDRSSIPALIEALSSFSHPVDVLAALRFVCAKPDEVKLSQMKDKLKEHSAFEWNERGSRLITSGEFWEALRCFEKATEIDPDWEVPRKNWADLEEHTFTPPKRDGDSCTSPLEPPPFAELILESEMKGEMKRTYDLLKDLIKIGRSPDPDKRPEASEDEKGLRNDILVPDETVSRWHGAIRKVKDEYEYEDHSFNGTIICGTKLIKGGTIKLSHGDKIIISETRFRFLNRNDPTFYKILTDWNKGPCPGRRRLFGL